MSELVEQLIAYIGKHAALAPWIMVIFAACETTAFLSILVPSTAVMVAVGAFAANGVLDFWSLVLGASLGALLGSGLSFWLGRRYGVKALEFPPLNRHPEWIEQAQSTFARWGALAILLGHFTTILRPVAFLMAGISSMPIWRFAFWNALGCFAWAFVVLKFGEVGGTVLSWLYSKILG